jgi:hypothetical protein
MISTMANVQLQSQEIVKTDAPAFDDIDSASEALLARWEDAEKLSEQETDVATAPGKEETDSPEQEAEEEDTELLDDEAEEDPDEEGDAEEAEEDQEEEITLDDDTLVEIMVDGEAQQASISQLKRLYGQEASLTRKSQDVAKQRKEAEEQIGKTSVVLQRMLEKAQERYKPYSEVDMLVASKSMNTEDFAQLRKEAQTAADDVKFLEEEADNYFKQLQSEQQKAMQEQARDAVKVLQEDIPEWSNNLYDDIRAFAVSQGLPEEQVNTIIDPAVIKILNKARLFDQAKKITTTKKKRTSKKVLRATKAPNTEANDKSRRVKDARAKLQNSHDMDDIAEALLSRWDA